MIETAFFSPDQIMVMDFNHVSQIERAISVNSIKSTELFVEYILKFQKSEKHYNMIMMVLPQLLTSGNVDQCFMEFFKLNGNAGDK